jgi:hypothetical protein
MTARESSLISKLRSKLGDNPTIIQTSGTTTTYIPDVAKQIWNDDEYLVFLTDAMTVAFSGKKDSFDSLDVFDEQVVVLRANIDMLYVMATDSSRYTKYTLRDVNVEKQSPAQFLDIAKSLEKNYSALGNESS